MATMLHFLLYFLILPENSQSLSLTRSNFLRSSLPTALFAPQIASAADAGAIGSSERTCRARGDCLKTGNFDGALGFNWGGADRCPASDPACSSAGKVLEVRGAQVATPLAKTRKSLMRIAGFGHNEEQG